MTTATTERVEVRSITENEVATMVMKQLGEVNRLENIRKQRSKERASAQDAEKEAKAEYEDALEQLKSYQRELDDGLPFDGEPEKLLPTVFLDDDNQAIRAVRIEDLDLSSAIRARLTESDDDCKKPQCITLGDLEEWVNTGGRLNKIKTVTDKKLPSIREAIRKACEPFTGDGEAEAA